MPESNIELARRGFDAFNRGDVAAVARLLSPDVEIHTAPELPNAGEFRGHEGFREWSQAWLEAWEDFRVEMGEVTSVGDSLVIGVRQYGTGRGSGLAVEMEIAYVFRFRDGAVTGLELHPDRERALAAVG